MLKKLKYTALGVLAAISLGILAQTQILDLDVLGTLDITTASPELQITETDATADNGIWLMRAVAEQFRFEACTDALSCPDIMTVDRTGSTVDTINLLPTTLQMNGIDLSVETGQFTVTYDAACTTSPTMTFDYYKVGDMVTIKADLGTGFPCTSDSTSFGGTGADIPASIRPAANNAHGGTFYGVFLDNGANTGACPFWNSNGTMTIGRENGTGGCSSIAWTNSGNKTFSTSVALTSTYLLTDP